MRRVCQIVDPSIDSHGAHVAFAAYRTEAHAMRRLRILVAASVLALGALPSPVRAELFVSSQFTNTVLRYGDGTGAFINAFVAAGSGGLAGPAYLVFRSFAPIPTVSEWGMILLALSLLTLGTWQVTGRPALLGVAPTFAGALLRIPSRHLLRSVLVGQMVASMGLVLYGGLIDPVAAHDVLGAVLAGMLLGAMIECYRRGQGR